MSMDLGNINGGQRKDKETYQECLETNKGGRMRKKRT